MLVIMTDEIIRETTIHHYNIIFHWQGGSSWQPTNVCKQDSVSWIIHDFPAKQTGEEVIKTTGNLETVQLQAKTNAYLWALRQIFQMLKLMIYSHYLDRQVCPSAINGCSFANTVIRYKIFSWYLTYRGLKIWRKFDRIHIQMCWLEWQW